VSFPSKKELEEYIHFKEEAEKRDHRKVGRAQEIFDTHELAPGCAFFYPNGTKVYNKLCDLVRAQYKVRGFHEVITPNIFNVKLFKTSGHYSKYLENMFLFKNDDCTHGMKPMNCPSHCLMFANQLRSYREMPLRLADFGVLHRNELAGALSGLTRVRRFQQDDAHIFCTSEQLKGEIISALDFIDYVYSIFGMRYTIELSTRPKLKLGSEELWDGAEAALADALNDYGKPYTINPGDGAFYGPKIDIKLQDSMNRKHQCGTIQCDFQLPIRFNLQYQSETAAED